MLKPHDVVVVVKLLESKSSEIAPTYAGLSAALRLSPSEVHAAVARAVEAGLLRKPSQASSRTMPVPVASALAEFLIHGIKYVWPSSRGAMTRGIPTGSSVAAVAKLLNTAEPAIPLVWPHPEGTIRGESVDPLYPRAAEVVANDPFLHQWLALIDILRLKSGRESSLAAAAIQRRLA